MDRKTDKEISRGQILLLSVAAGLNVANIYYNQPILKEIAETFQVNETKAGFISILSQVGYGLGLFFITPLGDKINKTKLILVLQLLLVLSLIGITISGTISQTWVLSVLISFFAVSVQVVMPLVAGLDSKNRGKNVGTIFTGVLIGILAARVFSGFIAEWFGWRSVYGLSAVFILILSVLLKISLPNVANHFDGSYMKLLGSTLWQVKRFKLLRSTSTIGALQFGVFTSFWTTLTFHLSGGPFNYSSDKIGLFGLVAIAGAVMAPYIGKHTDKGGSSNIRFLALGLVIFSILLMLFFPYSVIALVVAVLLLDIGIQSMQVTNVALIYTLDETSHSRINTIFMTSVFVGGAIGTFAGVVSWHFGGWLGVNLQMLLWACVILPFLIKERNLV